MGQMERVSQADDPGGTADFGGAEYLPLDAVLPAAVQMEIVRQDGYAGSLARYTIFHHLPVFAPLLAGVILLIYGISVFRREYSRTACEESGDAGTDQEKRA